MTQMQNPQGEIDHKFLFILSPPYCGTTLLNQLICTSINVSVNNPQGNREGQRLPEVEPIMFSHGRRWDETFDFDWPHIKMVWMKHWDPGKTILLEKSPPNMIRAKSILANFTPSYFIIMYREPYAHCESLMRRGQRMNHQEAARFVIRCLEKQIENLRELPNTIQISYEFMTDQPAEVVKAIGRFLPELQDMDITREFSAHNLRNTPLMIQNLNQEKISKLSPADIFLLNEVFSHEKPLLELFGYALREPITGSYSHPYPGTP